VRKDERQQLIEAADGLLRSLRLIHTRRRPYLYAVPTDAVRNFRSEVIALVTAPECRKRRWSEKQVTAGRCRACGQPRQRYRSYCDECVADRREQDRFRRGCRPWRRGAPGRPPKSEHLLTHHLFLELWKQRSPLVT
jgi:hypothetical protein